MTNVEIDSFIKKYGGNGIDFYVGKISRSFSAITYCWGKNEKTNKRFYVIVLDRNLFRNKKNPIELLHALLLHEIGHIKCKHFERKIVNSTAEYEAQSWAITTALKYKKFNIIGYLIQIILEWGWLIHNKKRLRYYYGAYRKFCKFVGKDGINNWKKYLKENYEYRILDK